MEINISKLESLLVSNFDNNKSLMARKLGIETSHLNKVFHNNGRGAGAKFCGAIMKYCEENDLDYKQFIFLNKNVNKFTN